MASKNKKFSLTFLALILGLLVGGLFALTSPLKAYASELTGDVNGNGVVNISDLAIMANNWGVTTGATLSMGDLNGDGAVNIEDLAILASHWDNTNSELPAVPTGLSATGTSATTATISWSADSGSGLTYLLYRDGSEVTSTTSTSYDDSGLTSGDTYDYTIAASDSYGTSDQSSQVGVTLSGGSDTVTPLDSVDCDYQTDTWSGDASEVGYSVTPVSSSNGNPASFSVVLNADHGTTEVVGYPSDQCLMYSALPDNLGSAFNITPPTNSSGLDYEFAYDIWLTTASAAESANWDNDLELMIWTYVNGQVPAGSDQATLTDGSEVWVSGNNTTGTVSVVLPSNETSGTVNISSIINQLISLGYITSADNGILDIEYGIEAPYGGGQTFTVNSISDGTID